MARLASKVGVITKRISKDILGLRRDMVALCRALEAVASSERRGGATPVGRGAVPRRRRNLTAKDRARLKIQGEYLGLVRHLSARNRSKVKELRARRGYASAIRAARLLVRGRS